MCFFFKDLHAGLVQRLIKWGVGPHLALVKLVSSLFTFQNYSYSFVWTKTSCIYTLFCACQSFGLYVSELHH